MPDPDRPDSRDIAETDESATFGLSRREFTQGALGATITSGLFAGCSPCFGPKPPRAEPKRKRGPRTFTLRAPIRPGEYRRVRRLLDDPAHNPFQTSANGIHYARLFTTDHRWLYFMVIYDDYWNAIGWLGKNAEGIDRLFSHCSGYPAGGAADAKALDEFIEQERLCIELFYRAYTDPQPEIRDALTMRDHFLGFLQSIDGVDEAELRRRYSEFLQDPHLYMHDDSRRGRRLRDAMKGPTSSQQDLRLTPVNSPDRVRPFTLLARVHADQLRRLKRLLRLGTFANIDLGARPLKNLPTLHFARVSIVDDDYMLFASVYDGDFMQYVEDFGTRISKEIDTVFGACIGYPLAGSRDVFQFKDFLRAHQIDTAAFAGAYLGRSLLQIQSSLQLTDELEKLARKVEPDDRGLRRRLDKFLHANQHLLT